MQPGDVATYWPAYHDHYLPVELGAILAGEQSIGRAERLLDYIADPDALVQAPTWTFFPPLLGAGLDQMVSVPALMTGGRTFLLGERGADVLGIPPRIHLDLERLGWGSGTLEFRPEVKGAGTLFPRTLLRRDALERLLTAHPELARRYADLCVGSEPPVILSSKAMYLKRILGGHDGVYASHALKVSESMFGTSEIKFAPVWTVSGFPAQVARNLDIISGALPAGTPLSDRTHANLVRFTPGTVRARYFDTARSDAELMWLASRVSTDIDELWATWHEMLDDARRYLADVARTTIHNEQGFRWAKVGDINEVFKQNHLGEYERAFEYRHRRREAWFLSKDEVVIRRIGKVFVDLESLWGGSTRFTSPDERSLRFHHELVALMVLRDHVRVCTAFRVAIELHERGSASVARRHRLRRETVTALAERINASELLECTFRPREVQVRFRYPGLGHAESYHLPRWQIREPYPD
jgi:hypothetical protein